MKKQLLPIILIAMLALSACGSNTADTVTTSSQSVITGDIVESDMDAQEDELDESDGYGLDLSFESEDIYGEPITDEIFANNKLTLINIFATWCPPCVEELPHLAKLKSEYEDQGFEIAGFVTDVRSVEDLSIDEEALSAAKALFESSNSTYPYIIPDETFLHEFLFVQYYPSSIFVDSKGNIVGDPIVGANDYEGWKAAIEERLAML